jgi:P-type Cu2+ transporter
MKQSVPTLCFHCGLPCVEEDRYQAKVLEQTRTMCCPGCKAVAEAIVANGLQDYYRFRSEPGSTAPIDLLASIEGFDIFDDKQLQEEFVYQQGTASQIQLTIEGISCAACGWLIEKRLAGLPGIQKVAVNVASHRAIVSWQTGITKLSIILSEIKKIGYQAQPFEADQHEVSLQKEHKSYLKRLGVTGLITMQVMMLALGLYFGVFGNLDEATKNFFHWVSLLLTTPIVIYSASVFYTSATKAILARSVNMDVPISIAIIATYLASAWATLQQQGQVYFESVCMFIFLLLISRYLEQNARRKSAQISANMLGYMPLAATVIDGTEQQHCLAKKLQVGQRVLVKAGETIPIDGLIINGHGQVDEAMLSGEFEPVDKQPLDTVYAGTVNHSGTFELEVKSTLKHALVNQIVRLQEMAMASKPRIAMQADILSRYFVAAVLTIAALTFSYWYMQGDSNALWITVSVLVATCPCALALATPSALSCAMATLNKNGILLKRADTLEKINQLNTLVVDKTGTLTEGKFAISGLSNFSTLTDAEIVQLAASLEAYSEHPIGKAFVTQMPLKAVTQVSVEPGRGIIGCIDGEVYRIGSAEFMTQPINNNIKDHRVFLQHDGQLLSAFTLSDELKTDAADFIQHFKHMTLLLLSGDSEKNVSSIAEKLHIKDWNAGQTPEQKLAKIKALQESGHGILMLGDGINDGPVLAQADVSIAVSNASDLARNAADIILMQHKLTDIEYLFVMAKLTRRTIRQNIVWALAYNIAVLPLAVTGYLSPWMAVIGMSLSSIVVVWNSTTLLTRSGK